CRSTVRNVSNTFTAILFFSHSASNRSAFSLTSGCNASSPFISVVPLFIAEKFAIDNVNFPLRFFPLAQRPQPQYCPRQFALHNYYHIYGNINYPVSHFAPPLFRMCSIINLSTSLNVYVLVLSSITPKTSLYLPYCRNAIISRLP